MRFLELTQYQHDSARQDNKICINVDKIVRYYAFKYSNGDVITTLETEKCSFEVVETYDVISHRIQTLGAIVL